MTGIEHFRPGAAAPAFSARNKAARILWGLSWLLLARFTPPQLHGWRRALLRIFGAKVGANARIYGSVKIWLPRNLELGEGTIIGPGAHIYNQGRISIGAHCVVSQRAHLCASTHRLSDPHFALELRPVTLGDGCWVASEAFVGPGVTMAAGSVLGARAALFEDSEAMGIYRGNPAQRIASRTIGH